MNLGIQSLFFFFFNDTATTEIYTLSLHDALPIWAVVAAGRAEARPLQEGLLPSRIEFVLPCGATRFGADCGGRSSVQTRTLDHLKDEGCSIQESDSGANWRTPRA